MSHFIFPLPHQCSAIIIKNMDSFSTLRSFMFTLAILDPMKFNEIKDIIQRYIFKCNPFIREIIEINNNIDTIVTRTNYMKYINRLYNIGISYDYDYDTMLEARKFTEQCSNSRNNKFINITKTIYPSVSFNTTYKNTTGFNIHSIVIPFNYPFI
jgi:hypothetical protein